MTELLTRPPSVHAPTTEVDQPVGGSLWVRGTLAALWSVATGVAVLLVVVLVVWATDSRSGAGAGQTLRVGLQLWLAGHKVPLHVGRGSIAVAPLGLTLGLAFLVARAAAVLARGRDVQSPSGLLAVGAAIGIPYAVLTAFVAAAATGGSVRPSPVAALVAGAGLGGLAATWGAARGTGRLADLVAGLPADIGRVLRSGLTAVAILAGAGLLLTVGSLAVHARTASELADSLGGGFVAALALLVLDALLVPNAALTAIGYLSGPGFAVGTGTSVSLGGAHLPQLPAVPLLAAVPHGAAPAAVRLLVVVLLLAAGAAAGWRAADTSPWRSVARALGAGAVAGAAASLLVALAGGPAGPGRMAAVGASPWQVGLAVAGEVGLVAALVAGPAAYRRR